MENGRENSSSLSNTSKEASARKKRKSNSKTSEKSSSPKASSLKHSKKPLAHGDLHQDAEMAGESEKASVEPETVAEPEFAGASSELPLKRNIHSKSRSRSSSRSRFSGFFKRKKRSKSETDLGQILKDKIGHEHESPSCTDVSQEKVKTNLKRVSPHHAFDSRVRPRDRLMNMTVRDAVKEQRLRRVHSAGRSPHRPGIHREDDASVTRSHFEPIGVASEINSYSSKGNQYTASTLPRPSKGSIISSDPERSAFYKYSSNPELKNQMMGLIGSANSKELTSLDRNALSSPQDCRNFSSLEGMGESPMAEIDLDDFVIDYASKLCSSSRTDSQNDGEDAKTLVNVSISSQEDDVTDSFKQTNSPSKNVSEAQRKASLTRFLELRQHPPLSLARHQYGGTVGYDPITTREHAQVQSYRGRDSQTWHEVQESKSPLPSVQEINSDISVPILTAPRLSLNGEEVENFELSMPMPAIRPTSIFLEDSAVDSSSLSSSPQINSMASSFRSSDQGYAESDGDSSDDNSAFSTPPEESEYVHSNQLTATVLQKLLDPIKEKQKGNFQVIDSNVGFIEGSQLPNRTLEQVKANIDSGSEPVPGGLLSTQRYVPRGVRRSKSDISSRKRPYRRYFRNTSSPPVKSKLDADEPNSPLVTPTTSEAGDSLSAVSASTLTGTDSFNGLYTRNTLPIKLANSSIPFMSPATQKRYKRSFSPFRAKEVVSPFIASDAPTETSIKTIPPELSKSSTAVLSPSSQNYPDNLPGSARKGILKSLSKEDKKNADSTAEARQGASSQDKEKLDSVKLKDAAKEANVLPVSYPDIEIVIGPSANDRATTPAANVSSVSRRVTLPEKAPSPTTKRHETVTTPSPLNSTSSAPEKAPAAKALPLIPLFHGLEVGRHREPLTPNYTLADYIKEQSFAAYGHNQKVDLDVKVDKKADKEVRGWRKSFKRKSKKDRKDQKKERLEKPEETSPVHETVFHSSKTLDSNKFTIMVDKQIQTSAWLINSLASKKTPKLKKRSQSMKRHKRRDSVVSDTFMPTEPPKYKEAYQRSSLGDLRKTAEAKSMGIVAFSTAAAASSSSTGRSNGILRPRPMVPGSSSAPEVIKPDPSASSPKPKKLSLTAVILLKNRLARFREKKRKDKGHKQSTEVAASDFHSDTMVSIENELNLSKLEISKETDIIDDIFEPDFSLDYPKKHIRFEPSEPMQSEEPLPPLPPSSSRRLRQRRESTMRERKRKCIQYCKKFIAFLFSHIGLCSLVVAYTILGGFIFQALEQKPDGDVRSDIAEKRFKVVNQLISMAVEMRKTEEGVLNFTEEVNNTILEYQTFIHEQTKERGWDGKEGSQEDGPWTFASALLYAITVTTTIGYGHVAPKTPEGRIVTIAYAVVGIPLTLLCLTNIGDVMATGFRLLYGKVCCGLCCTMFKPRRRRLHVDIEKGLGVHPLVTTEEEEPDKPKEVIHVPTSLCLLLIAAYICSGAWLFSSWEQWDYLTAAYFCFITLSTIGFGDIVPGMDNNAWAQEEKLVLCALYLVLGLSLIAMCFNLVQEDVKVKCRWLGMKLGLVEKPQAPI